MGQLVSRNYAQALLEVAEGNENLVLRQLQSIVNYFKNNPTFAEILSHPNITKEEQRNVFDTSLHGFLDIVHHFLNVLIDNKRLELLPNILLEYKGLLNEKERVLEFKVYSGTVLLKKEEERIKSILASHYNVNIDLEVIHDPDQIGGLIVVHKDLVIDDSLKTKLNNIHHHLIS